MRKSDTGQVQVVLGFWDFFSADPRSDSEPTINYFLKREWTFSKKYFYAR